MRFTMRAGLMALCGCGHPAALGPAVVREGVSVRFPAGAEQSEITAPDWRATVARLDGGAAMARLNRDGPVGDIVGATITERGSVTVCGRPAQRLVVRIPALHAIPTFVDDEGVVSHGKPDPSPDIIETRLVFTVGKVRASVEWSVEASRRHHYRRAERAFLASIRCP